MKQLTAEFVDEGTVRVSRVGVPLIDHPVEYVNRSQSWIKPRGNGKTEHYGNTGLGIINCLRNGCFRSCMDFERSDVPCYQDEGDHMTGCYAQLSTFAMIRWNSGFSVIHNGVQPGTEEFFRIMLPKNGDYSLARYPTRVWRVDSESSTACMSLALGLTQRWARANPDRVFTGISSDYFYVSDERLRETADCGNVVVGFSLSAWFSVEELQSRIASARRFRAAGVPTTLWVVSRGDWEEDNREGARLIKEAVAEVDPRSVIALAYHDRSGHVGLPETPNPHGPCCRVGVDSEGEYAPMDLAENLRGSCHLCPLGCGAAWLRCC